MTGPRCPSAVVAFVCAPYHSGRTTQHGAKHTTIAPTNHAAPLSRIAIRSTSSRDDAIVHSSGNRPSTVSRDEYDRLRFEPAAGEQPVQGHRGDQRAGGGGAQQDGGDADVPVGRGQRAVRPTVRFHPKHG